jgi:hypothetical protein
VRHHRNDAGVGEPAEPVDGCVELFEVQPDEGPCPDSYRRGAAVICDDLVAVDGRWPRFAPRATEAGVVSVLALPMRLRGLIIGRSTCFAFDTGAIDDDSVVVCQVALGDGEEVLA